MIASTSGGALASRSKEWLGSQEKAKLSALPTRDRLGTFGTLRNLTLQEALREVSQASGFPILETLVVDKEWISVLPARLANAMALVPVKVNEDRTILHLATAWPPDADVVDWVALFVNNEIEWHVALPEKIVKLIVDNYGVGAGSLDDADGTEHGVSEESDLEGDEEAAVVRFVSQVIGQAVAENATDIHFEPQDRALRIRYRVDGILAHVPVPENLLKFQDAIISRLKIMARLNISERRLPQDGRIGFKAGDTDLDIRLSTYPTIYAESVSLRLLNQKRQARTLEELGMNQEEQRLLSQIVDIPHGIILVTGPTGSGKSTSLNAFLRQINSTEERIITIEDPIEYELPGANQGQVHPEIGLTFASALRHMLRQDPDVIMIGEIRDHETAEIAIQASLTGHLVFSTLHTNDAPGALTRLIDMGIEPYLVSSAVKLVLAQRLVRRLCPSCSRAVPVTKERLADTLRILALDQALAMGITTLKGPAGCDQCRGTGYRGRVGLFEIMRLGEDLHALVLRRESSRVLAKCARESGMRTLSQSAWEKITAGATTIEEVLRVISLSEE